MSSTGTSKHYAAVLHIKLCEMLFLYKGNIVCMINAQFTKRIKYSLNNDQLGPVINI